ncbi:MAG: hypothetical protein EP310_09100 [Bacteroidetes bacterium]|nr:MAG: hypothetical protein EP310_09100 [Bacteroidota bacterium]
MFTVGIFTTHIPYIAFVVFYAWFILFGVSKAVSGEIENGEKCCKTEWVAEKNYHFSDSNSGNFYINPGILNYNGFEEIQFKRKIIHPEYDFFEYKQDYFCSSLFCRPPPVA